MSDMVERVEKAIWEERRRFIKAREPDLPELDEWGNGTVPKMNNVMGEAAAAIAAMREPTAHECIDEDGSDRWGWQCNICGGPKENWERVIDAALK